MKSALEHKPTNMDRYGNKLLIGDTYMNKLARRMDTAKEVSETGDGHDPETGSLNYDLNSQTGELTVKVICLGDSAVGKSKLLERFLVNAYKPQQVSTYALTLYRYKTQQKDQPVVVDFWDTAGQERFFDLHPSYYHQAHACVIVFDATRKITYKNLPRWFSELRRYRPEIPCYCAANKIDVNADVTGRSFAFAEKNSLPLYFVSASDGTNVVKLFRDAIAGAVKYKKDPTDWTDQLLTEMEQVTISSMKSNKDDSCTN